MHYILTIVSPPSAPPYSTKPSSPDLCLLHFLFKKVQTSKRWHPNGKKQDTTKQVKSPNIEAGQSKQIRAKEPQEHVKELFYLLSLFRVPQEHQASGHNVTRRSGAMQATSLPLQSLWALLSSFSGPCSPGILHLHRLLQSLLPLLWGFP